VLKKCSAADLSVINGIVPSSTAEAAVALVGDGTYLYTVDFSGGTGKARVRKFDSGLNLLASSADFPLAADGSGNSQRLVLCAGSLWVGLVYSSIVRRINPATLATVTDISVTAASDVATDGTYVYVRQNQSAHIAKIDPASNTVTATFTVDQDLTFSYLACAGGHLFTQKLDGTLRATNTSDGSNASHGLGKPGAAPSAGDGHVAFTDDVTRTVTIVDATSLAAYGSFGIPLPPGGRQFTCTASLLTRDQVIAARDSGTYVDEYDRVALGAGTRVDVYQLSSTVGRGFAATKTL
jgi:DNA-binding beta-propeller fold protein YncE